MSNWSQLTDFFCTNIIDNSVKSSVSKDVLRSDDTWKTAITFYHEPVKEVVAFAGEESLRYVRGEEEPAEEEPGDLQVVVGDAGAVLGGRRGVICDDVVHYRGDEQHVDAQHRQDLPVLAPERVRTDVDYLE